MEKSVIPNNYEEWRHSIVIEGGLELSPSFIEQRISSLQNSKEKHTQQFIKLYGQEYHQKVLAWFIQSRETL